MQPSGKNEMAPPALMVVFGASGDLFARLLLPALLNLAVHKKLPDGFALLGFAKEQWSESQFRQHLTESAKHYWGEDVPEETLAWLRDRAFYLQGDFDEPHSFAVLKSSVDKVEKDCHTCGNRLFYLAVAPAFISSIVKNLSEQKLCVETGDTWRRIIVEKPFGTDLDSARKLNAELLNEVKEDQIYRIDHFAGKETVHELAVLRFANTLFEPFWNRTYIENIQITVAETVGLEGRAGFYEKSGALRDMVPNHLSELLSIVAMEPPVSFNAEHTRSKQADVLQSVRVIAVEDVHNWAVRGQYGPGHTGGGEQSSYRSEKDVPPDSFVETYVALCVLVDTWRWAGVPFYLRTGKRLKMALTEVVITLKAPPTDLFSGLQGVPANPNRIIFRMSPSAGISISFVTKPPEVEPASEPNAFKFMLPEGTFGKHANGYERLLLDCMFGDPKLFNSAEMVEGGWAMIQPILEAWKSRPQEPFPNYDSGSSGPTAADKLLARRGHAWHALKAE